MSKIFDPKSHIGETHGVYTLVDMLEEKDKYGHYVYKGVCNECGYVKFAHYGNFSGPTSKTLVCKHLDARGEYIKNTRWGNRRIGNIFKGMKTRCYDVDDDDYSNYGAKGVCICNEWLDNPLSFEEWSLSNGYNDTFTIDRINCDGNYDPKNCRWVTREENSKNKPTTNFIEINGEIHTGREWAQKLGFSINRINQYIQKHGIKNVTEFIKRYMENPTLEPKHKQSYYDLYMNTVQN